MKFLPTVRFLVADADLCALVVVVPQSDLEVGSRGGSGFGEDRTSGAATSTGADGKDAGEGMGGDEGKSDGTGSRGSDPKSPASLTYSVQLRNSIGCVVDSRTLPFEPLFVSMSDKHFVAANERTVYVWHFRGSGGSLGGGGGLSVTMGRGGMNTSGMAAVAATRSDRPESADGGGADGDGTGNTNDDNSDPRLTSPQLTEPPTTKRLSTLSTTTRTYTHQARRSPLASVYSTLCTTSTPLSTLIPTRGARRRRHRYYTALLTPHSPRTF